MKFIPIITMPQLSDAAWSRLTAEDPEDPVERILRENQIDLLEVMTNVESA